MCCGLRNGLCPPRLGLRPAADSKLATSRDSRADSGGAPKKDEEEWVDPADEKSIPLKSSLAMSYKLAGVSVFDVYEGAGIDAGKKSVAIAVTIQPRDKTMTEAEIDALAAKIVAEVGKRADGVLRA